MNALVFLALSLTSAHRIEQKMSMVGAPAGLAGQAQAQKSVMLWDGSKLRTDNGTTASSIVDFKTDHMVVLDHSAKQYSEMKISELLAQMKAAVEQMKAQAQALPPEQRKAYEGMLAKQAAPVQLEATDEKQQILGFDAKKYVLKQNDKAAGEVWYTKAIDLADLAPYMKQYAEMVRGAGGNNLGDVMAKTENGYALKSVIVVDMMGQKISYVTETTKYEKVPGDAKAFEVPAGYKKVDPNAAHKPGKTDAAPGGAVPAKRSNEPKK